MCQVRPDIGCKHRPAQGAPPPAISEAGKKKRKGGQPANLNSRWGKAGNPKRREVEEMLQGGWRPKQ